MWVKLCGMVRPVDLEFAVALKVDAVGVIAVPGTPRCVSVTEATVLGGLPRKDTRLVLVMMNPAKEYAGQMIGACKPDLLQFHGDEQTELAESFGFPYIKAVKSFSLSDDLIAHPRAWAWLLDSRLDGSGDCEAVQKLRGLHSEHRVILAGGLSAATIPETIARYSPWGVDVSRGIERAPREKDHNLMKEFVHAARSAGV